MSGPPAAWQERLLLSSTEMFVAVDRGVYACPWCGTDVVDAPPPVDTIAFALLSWDAFVYAECGACSRAWRINMRTRVIDALDERGAASDAQPPAARS